MGPGECAIFSGSHQVNFVTQPANFILIYARLTFVMLQKIYFRLADFCYVMDSDEKNIFGCLWFLWGVTHTLYSTYIL
jgi:hypothetical protein